MNFFKEARNVTFRDLTLYIVGYIEKFDDLEFLIKYHKYGKDIFANIDGKFALAILNSSTHNLFITTDFYGTYFVYYTFEDEFNFGLNYKTISTTKEIDKEAIELYLHLGSIPLDFSPYKNVKKLLPNSYIELDLISYNHIIKTHKKTQIDIVNYDYSDALSLVENGIKDEIEKIDNLDSCGLLLSGGIDSGILAYYASQNRQNIKTFTISFDGVFDESKDAKTVSKILKTDHKTISISPDLNSDIKTILNLSNEPFFDSSLIPSYYACKEAKNYTDTIIVGDGSDEIFGGYRRYVPAVNNWYKVAKYFSIFLPIIPKPNHKNSIYNWIYRLIRTASSTTEIEYWLKSRVELIENYDSNKLNIINKMLCTDSKTKLTKELLNDHNLLLFSDLIPKMKIASEANNLKLLSPFLSKDMHNIAFSLDDKYKINGTKTKYILRELYKTKIDKNLAYNKKRGFEVPLKSWINGVLNNQINDYIFSANSYWKNYYSNEIFTNLDPEREAKIKWLLFTLEIWYENR